MFFGVYSVPYSVLRTVPNGPPVVRFVFHMLTPSIKSHDPIYTSLVSSSSVEPRSIV